MKDAESEKLRTRYNTPGTEIAVAKDGVTFYVNEANKVEALTEEQLKGIYLGDITNWKAVGGADAPIIVYSRENSSGTYVFVKDNLLEGEDYASSAQTLPGTAAVVNAVSKEKNGIGYGGAAYAKGIKELKIKKGKRGARPQRGERQERQVPALARPLLLPAHQAVRRRQGVHRLRPVRPRARRSSPRSGYFPVK